MKKILLLNALFLTGSLFAQNILVNELGRFTDGREDACEISTYDQTTKRIFTTNSAVDSIDIIDLSDINAPVRINQLDVLSYGGGVNSLVSLNNGYFAAAIEAYVKTDSGSVVIYDVNGTFVASVKVGFLPDMITYAPLTKKLLVACEGEPNDEYTIDPEGSIAIIDLSNGVDIVASNVTTLGFSNAPINIPGSIRKPGTAWSQDLEPEYIAFNADETKAVVICQESNVFVIIDLTTNSISSYKGLGFKDHSVPGNGFDASDKDGIINIQTWNVLGVYQPDAIAMYEANGNDYIITANEGDGRDYDGYSSETRVEDLDLDVSVYATGDSLQKREALGRLKTFTKDVIGDLNADNQVEQIYSYGARSFSIWDDNGDLLWDSGDAIEQYFAANYSDFFNCNDGLADEKDKRSDDKGPEPESVCIGIVGGNTLAFIGLERQGGVLVYNVSNPLAPTFVTFINSYDYTNGTMTDIGPEGLQFIPASESHTGENFLMVSNEVSGTISFHSLNIDNVNIDEKGKETIGAYPNPTNGTITIAGLVGSAVRVFNFKGQVLMNTILEDESMVLDLSVLTSGIYLLEIINENGIQLDRIVKL
ncbi:MAG: hypothetical protein ACI8ZO_000680 [Flavobacteriales bacterium]|jgi:hypothetical protein